MWIFFEFGEEGGGVRSFLMIGNNPLNLKEAILDLERINLQSAVFRGSNPAFVE